MSTSAACPSYAMPREGWILASRCDACGQLSCPPRFYHCDRPTGEVELPATGTIEVWTMVHVAPTELNPPYRIAYVRLDDGPRVVARLAEFEPDPSLQRVRLTQDARGLLALAGGLA